VLENFVLMELRKQSAWSQTGPEIYFWRTVSGQEVDIVLFWQPMPPIPLPATSAPSGNRKSSTRI
jgi:predicted AAA+ superfamily ATPase